MTLKVFHNGVEKDSYAISGTTKIGNIRTIALSAVAVGDQIDIALTPVGLSGGLDDGADGSFFSARILRNTFNSNATYTNVADSIADWSTAGQQGFRG